MLAATGHRSAMVNGQRYFSIKRCNLWAKATGLTEPGWFSGPVAALPEQLVASAGPDGSKLFQSELGSLLADTIPSGYTECLALHPKEARLEQICKE